MNKSINIFNTPEITKIYIGEIEIEFTKSELQYFRDCMNNDNNFRYSQLHLQSPVEYPVKPHK